MSKEVRVCSRRRSITMQSEIAMEERERKDGDWESGLQSLLKLRVSILNLFSRMPPVDYSYRLYRYELSYCDDIQLSEECPCIYIYFSIVPFSYYTTYCIVSVCICTYNPLFTSIAFILITFPPPVIFFPIIYPYLSTTISPCSIAIITPSVIVCTPLTN